MYSEAETDNFERDLERYERAIEEIEDNQPKVTDEQIVEALIARDRLQNLMEDDAQQTGDHITRLCALDKRLRALGPTIAESVNLEELRGTLNRPTDHWWWTFEPPIDRWDRYDWVWNALTAGALALAASFMVNIVDAYAAGDATVTTALSAIVQAAGLAVLGRGALTVDGQEKVKEILASLNIPSRFHAESTFILAILLLITVYFSNSMLDYKFYNDGNGHYEKGHLTNAKQAYIQASEIDPDYEDINYHLGKVYESLGDLDSAYAQYLIGSEKGDSRSLNGLGRVSINRKSVDNQLAEAYLLLGLQRAETNQETSPYLHYQLNRNIGWALIQQKKYADAIDYLEKAMGWLDQVGEKKDHTEGLMGYCFLAYAYEEEGERAKANETWEECINHGDPHYIHEYRWLIEVGKDDVAYCVNTDHVVSGYEGQRTPDVDERCNNLEVVEN